VAAYLAHSWMLYLTLTEQNLFGSCGRGVRCEFNIERRMLVVDGDQDLRIENHLQIPQRRTFLSILPNMAQEGLVDFLFKVLADSYRLRHDL